MDEDVSWMDDHSWRPAAAAGGGPVTRPVPAAVPPARAPDPAAAPPHPASVDHPSAALPTAPEDVPWHADPVVTSARRPAPVRVVAPPPSRPAGGLSVVDPDRPGTFVLVNGSATVVPLDRAAAIAAGYVVLDTEAAESTGTLAPLAHPAGTGASAGSEARPTPPAAGPVSGPAPSARPDRLPFDDRRAGAPLRIVPPLPAEAEGLWAPPPSDEPPTAAVPPMPEMAMPEMAMPEPVGAEVSGFDQAPPLEDRNRPWALELATATAAAAATADTPVDAPVDAAGAPVATPVATANGPVTGPASDAPVEPTPAAPSAEPPSDGPPAAGPSSEPHLATLPVGADPATVQAWLRELARRRSVGPLATGTGVPVGAVPPPAPVIIPVEPAVPPVPPVVAPPVVAPPVAAPQVVAPPVAPATPVVPPVVVAPPPIVPPVVPIAPTGGPVRVPLSLPDLAPTAPVDRWPSPLAPTVAPPEHTPPRTATPARPSIARSTAAGPSTATPAARPTRAASPAPTARPSTRGLGPVVLRARGVSRWSGRGRRAVDLLQGVDLDVRAGEIVLIDGPSGSGKSLLLRTLAGLEQPDRGAVELSGADLLRGVDPDRSRRRAVLTGFVHQTPHLVPTLDAADNAAMPLLLAGWSAADAADEVREAFRVLGLSHVGRAPVDRLRVGEQQRVNIARALVGGPSVVFADEPTGTLDDASAGAVLELLADLAAEGIAVVLVCHDPRARSLAHRVLGMSRGRLRGGPSS